MATRMISVHRLTFDDVSQLVDLHTEARQEGPIGICSTTSPTEDVFVAKALEMVVDDSSRMFGAFSGEGLVGVGVARHVNAGDHAHRLAAGFKAVDGGSAAHIDVLYVLPDYRRRGIGHQLLSEMADWASEVGAEFVACLPLPGAKRARRHLTRLGFERGLAHRVIRTDRLRRKLDPTGRRSWLEGIHRPRAVKPASVQRTNYAGRPGSTIMHVRRAEAMRLSASSDTTIS